MACVLTALMCLCFAPALAASKTVFTVVLTRHGVRSPTTAGTAPNWSPVGPGDLTQHGYMLMTYAGQYYAQSLRAAGLPIDCSIPNAYVYADRDQRTLETGRALIDGLCSANSVLSLYHSATLDAADSLFNNHPEPKPAAKNENPATSPTDAENRFLEYAQCLPLDQFDPGHASDAVTRLQNAMQAHVAMSNVERYSEPIASERGGNLLAHIIALLDARAGTPLAGVSGPDVSAMNAVFIVGHDTNIANVAGVLGAHWALGGGYVPGDTPPGGALAFDLLRGDDGVYRVRLRFVHQTLAQLRNGTALKDGTVSTSVFFDGCSGVDCSMPLADFSAIAVKLVAAGDVRPQWTASSSDPVTLPPLADPAWTQCE